MIKIGVNQIVVSNREYVSCQSGYFDPLDHVLCKRLNDESENTCSFLAKFIIEGFDEGENINQQ